MYTLEISLMSLIPGHLVMRHGCVGHSEKLMKCFIYFSFFIFQVAAHKTKTKEILLNHVSFLALFDFLLCVCVGNWFCGLT